MKKRWKSIFPSGGNMRKTIRCMKLTLLLLTCFVLQTFAGANAQTVTIKKQNATLEEVIWELKQQTSFSFMYNDVDIASIKGITLNETKVDVEEILQKCLKNTNLEYVVLNNAIVIKLKANTQDEKKSITLRGWVYDKQKEPLPGVTIKLANTIAGTATDNKGWFSLRLPVTKGTLEFSFVGFKTAKINFTEQTDTLRIYLEEDIQSLDETVVVAYGNTTKREMTGAISTIKADELKGIPSSNIMNLLQGRVAGMDVSNLAGSPGGGGTVITIRGYNSLDVEQGRRFSNPLWVVDGVPLNSFTSPVTGTNLLAEINPDMIESIQILKDASSAAIYGSRAANGVIIVTTKKGKKDQSASFSANFSQTWSILPKLPTITIGKAERDFRLQAFRNNPIAYLDATSKMYKYPTSLKEVFNHPSAGLDWFWIPDLRGAGGDGLEIQDSLNSFFNNATNFFPMYYETGKVTNANIQTYGGGDKFTYGIGLGYYDESGVFKGTGFNRIDLTANMNVIPVNKLNIDLRFYLSLTNRKRNTVEDENANSLQGEAPSVETVPGDPWTKTTLYPGKGEVVWTKILERLRGTKEKNRSVRGKANIKLSYDILPELTLSTSLAADYSIHRRNYFSPSYLSDRGYSISIGETGINLMALNENLLSFKKTFQEEHTFSFLAGLSYQYDQMEYNGGNGQKSPSDKIHYVSSGFPTITEEGYGDFKQAVTLQHYQSNMTEKALLSYFARLEYNYRQKYLLSASFRRDGSSTFGAKHRWGTFPSIAVAWTFTEENFLKNYSNWFNYGKIRASWGRSGMHFDQPYLALGVLYTGGQSIEGSPTLSTTSDGLYNEKLTWEETDQYDFGLDLDFFNYRLGIILDYYYRYTDKLLMPVPLPGNYNGYTSQWRNAGAVSNEGIELLIKYEILRKQDLYWKVSINGAKNWNQFRKSYDKKDTENWIIGKPLNGIYTFKTDGYINQQEEVPVFRNNVGVGNYLISSMAGKNKYYKPGDYKFVDVNGDGEINEGDFVYQGSALPIVSGGFVSEFCWKNFDLNLSMSFQLGRHIINSTNMNSLKTSFPNQYLHPLLLDLKEISFWEQPNNNHADYPMLQVDQDKYIYAVTIDRNVEKVNWLKMKTLSLGYSLPKALISSWKIEQIRVFASAENLFTWTNYSGIDPETVDIRTGVDAGKNYPLARRFTLGLTVKF